MALHGMNSILWGLPLTGGSMETYAEIMNLPPLLGKPQSTICTAQDANLVAIKAGAALNWLEKREKDWGLNHELRSH